MGEALIAPGWYPTPNGNRYYDGHQWLLTREDRTDRLDDAVNAWVRQGARVESKSAFDAVIQTGSEPNHVVHMLAVIFTCGLWLPIWIMAAGSTTVQRIRLHVDEQGVVNRV